MNTMLEQIIRQTLLEGAPTAILKMAPKKQFAKAKAAGADYAFAVRIRGASGAGSVANLVSKVSASSKLEPGQSPDVYLAVGEGSKYAKNDLDYMYIMSQPENKKQQLINVWIFKTPFELRKYFTDTENLGSIAAAQNRIGEARLIPVQVYNTTYAKPLGLPTLTIDSEEDLEPFSRTGDKDKTDDTSTKKITDIKYPYEYKTADANYTVYSIPSNTTKVYIETPKDTWLETDKKELEQFIKGETQTKPKFKIVTDNDVIDKLYLHVYQKVPKRDKTDKDEPVGDIKIIDIINATKTENYSIVTKKFQELMVKQIETQPVIVEILGDIYTDFKNDINGVWNEKSRILTKALQENMKIDWPMIATNGYPDTIFIQQIKKLNTWKIKTEESILLIKNRINEQGSFNIKKMKTVVDTLKRTGDLERVITNQPEKYDDSKIKKPEDKKKVDNNKKKPEDKKKVDNNKKKPEDKKKTNSKFQPGKQYELKLKTTKLYYFNNSTKKFYWSNWQWFAPSDTPIEYVSTSTHNKSWILVKIKTKKFYIPEDKIERIIPIQ